MKSSRTSSQAPAGASGIDEHLVDNHALATHLDGQQGAATDLVEAPVPDSDKVK